MALVGVFVIPINSDYDMASPENLRNSGKIRMIELVGKVKALTSSRSKLIQKLPSPIRWTKQSKPDITLARDQPSQETKVIL